MPNQTLLTEKKWPWIEDDRIPSQAEIDFYGSFDEQGNPTSRTIITQAHLDEIQGGMGIKEGHPDFVTLNDVKDNSPVASRGSSNKPLGGGGALTGARRRDIRPLKSFVTGGTNG